MTLVLVDREAERALIRDALQRRPSLVVMTGRRRVGKSFLLTVALAGERAVSLQGDEQGEAQHLELLAEEAGRVLIGAPALRFESWDAALTFLGAQASEQPLVVVLDEFQYLLDAQPALDSIVQRHWDRWQRAGVPIVLVLCGSALSLMEGLLAHGSPLHGRATARPVLAPLDYRDAAAFARTTDPAELIRRYAVLGGTPQYQVWAGPGELRALIRDRILTPGAPLYEEPLHLLREGEAIRDSGTYVAILRAIAGGATAHNAIAQQAGISTGNLSKKLGRLEALGYVARVAPLSAEGPERRSGYGIADPFFRFWFRFVARNRSRLERGRTQEVFAEVLADLDNVLGAVFEECCRHWIERYASEDLVGGCEQLGRFWSRDGRTEIDVVGVRAHRYELLGSCKWRRTVGEDVLDALYDARARLGGRAARARLAIFAREGFTPALEQRAGEEGVLLVRAADLFEQA